MKPDMRSLPLGLRRYRHGVFDKLHACGCGVLTASYVPALVGHHRFTGKYGLAAHIAGKVPLPDATNNYTRAGKAFQPAILGMAAAERRTWQIENLDAYARHPGFRRLIASPDALAWALDQGSPGIGEVKMVSDRVFKRDWRPPPGEPALDAMLQHQAQFACTGADWGFIACYVEGYSRDLHIYDTVPIPAAMDMILQQTRDLFALLDHGLLPEPDEHPASIDALHAIYPAVDPGKIVSLDGDEARTRFDEWQQAKLDLSKVKATEAACKAWFSMQDPEAGQFRIGNQRTVTVKMQHRREVVQPACDFRKWDLKREGD